MYFKKLELVGFKSFLSKTTLHFEPGITAVVGPNGCGKSNIFDSIRWVLGEQSAKSLRGSEMLDVIFNGTDNKEAVGMAEVSLTFDNTNRFFNMEAPEIEISRRLFRDGESEYLLNRTPVRLKDIMDLLLGTGIGAESYSIVAQGKIDMVLSSKPEERRQVFDEASGITKYKAQKRETLRKLEETEQNLLRVSDIVTEVKRQIGSLERQANKARRYREVFDELKNKEINMAILKKRELLKEKEEIISQLKAFELKESELLVIVREQEAKISNRQTEMKAAEEKMMVSKNQILNLENSLVRNTERISFNREKIEELRASEGYLKTQIELARQKITSDEEKLSKVKEEYGSLKKDIEDRSVILVEKESQISQLASLIRASLEAIAKTKKEIVDLAVRVAGAKNEISDFNSKQQIFIARKKRLEIEKVKVFEERAITEENLKTVTQESEELTKAVDELNQKISTLKLDLEKENLCLNDTNLNISELEKQRATLGSHKEFLEKLKSEYEDIGESMNALIYLDKLPKESLTGLVIKVKGYENLTDEDKAYLEPANFKVSGEAKPIQLDTQVIEEKLKNIDLELHNIINKKMVTQLRIEELNRSILGVGQELRNQEISLANKETSRQTVQEQFDKIKEEEDIIVLELSDVQREIAVLDDNLKVSNERLSAVIREQILAEDLIKQEEEGISKNSQSREELLVAITQTKTELDALTGRLVSDEATLKILEGSFNQDLESFNNIERQINDAENKRAFLVKEIDECQQKKAEVNVELENLKKELVGLEEAYMKVSAGASVFLEAIELTVVIAGIVVVVALIQLLLPSEL